MLECQKENFKNDLGFGLSPWQKLELSCWLLLCQERGSASVCFLWNRSWIPETGFWIPWVSRVSFFGGVVQYFTGSGHNFADAIFTRQQMVVAAKYGQG